MKAKNGFYSLIRHVPLPLSNHAEIVGVVLLCSDPDYFGVLFAMEGLRYLSGAFAKSVELKDTSTESAPTNTELAKSPKVFGSLTQLKEFLSDLGDEFQLTVAKRVAVANPPGDIESLLNRLLPAQDGRESSSVNAAKV